MPYRVQNDSKLAWLLVILLSIFILFLVIAHWMVNTRESACAEYCRLTGSAHYAYRDYAGAGESAHADSCHCISAGDPVKSGPDMRDKR